MLKNGENKIFILKEKKKNKDNENQKKVGVHTISKKKRE